MMTPAQLAAYQLRVNAWALAYASYQASARRNCLRIQPPTHPSWICSGGMLDPDLSRYTLNGTQASANFTWSIGSGTLPPGVTLDDLGHNTLNQAIAELGGTPTVPGKYSFRVQAASGSTVLALNDTLSVFGLVNPALPDATIGTPYSAQLTAAGGTDPVTFSGSAPAGLTLASDGTVGGMPTPSGDFTFDVTMTDAEGGVCTQSVTIKVTGGCPDWSTMNWDMVNFLGLGSASGIVSAFGDSFQFDLHGANDGSSSAPAQIHGSLVYTGPSAHLTLTLNLTKNGASGSSTVVIYVLQDGVPILGLLANGFSYPLGNSAHNFTVGAGVASVIEVQTFDTWGYIMIAGAGIPMIPFPEGWLQGSATISCIP